VGAGTPDEERRPKTPAERRDAAGMAGAGVGALGLVSHLLDLSGTAADVVRTVALALVGVALYFYVTWIAAWAHGMRHPSRRAAFWEDVRLWTAVVGGIAVIVGFLWLIGYAGE
jgi:hypothetical protein